MRKEHCNYKDYFYAMERDPANLYVPVDPVEGDELQVLIKELTDREVERLRRLCKTQGLIPVEYF